MKSNQPQPKEETSETAFPRGQENIVWARRYVRDLERTAVKQTFYPMYM